jgi:hypothetical protein
LSPHPASALRLSLTPARGWAALIAAVHTGAAVAALVWLPAPGAAAACAGLALSGWRAVSSALLRGPQAVRAIELRADGSAAYADAHGEWRAATVAATALLGHRYAALRLRAGRDRRDVALVPGSLSADGFRHARTWLRWRLPGL